MTHRSSLSVTRLFVPLLQRRGVTLGPGHASPPRITVPNVGSLPWEAIVEFRDHPGSQEARVMLREFVTRAAEGQAERGYEYLGSVNDAITALLYQALNELKPNLGKELASEALLAGVSIIPGVGNVIGPAASTTQAVRETRRFNRSWIAALMRLQPHS
jgi:hypothetical protein